MSTGLLDQALDTLAVKCVVETGTDNGWQYTKYSDGTYEAIYTGELVVSTGNLWSGGFYSHETSTDLRLPSFSKTWYLLSAVKNNGILMWFAGWVMRSSSLHFYIIYAGQEGTTIIADTAVIAIRGTW